jgi:hypothetical protein
MLTVFQRTQGQESKFRFSPEKNRKRKGEQSHVRLLARQRYSKDAGLHPSTGSWFETAFGLLTRRESDFNGLDLMVSLSNHGPHRFSAD